MTKQKILLMYRKLKLMFHWTFYRAGTKTSKLPTNIWLGILPQTVKKRHTCIVLSGKQGLFQLIRQCSNNHHDVIKHSFLFLFSRLNSHELTKLHSTQLISKQPKQLFIFTVCCASFYWKCLCSNLQFCAQRFKGLKHNSSSTIWSVIMSMLRKCK